MNNEFSQVAQNIIDQIPGIFSVMDLEGRYIGGNKYCANAMGFSTVDGLIGTRLCEVKCPVADSAPDFIKQNTHVTDNDLELGILDIHAYANNDRKILLTKKKPYISEGNVAGTIATCSEIESSTLQNISTLLMDSDKQYYNSKTDINRSYTVNNYNDTLLTPREQDVLFYVIRGKTMRQISELLHISARTVESHMINLKNKLTCHTKSDLIEAGLTRGYLTLIPKSLLGKSFILSTVQHQR